MQEQLFGKALGIEEPIYIDKIEFDKEKGELHIRMDFRRGGKFACSICKEEGQAVYDTEEKQWRHLNFFQYKCYLHMRTPRTKCPKCGEHLYIPPWGRKNSGFTMLFEMMILTLAKEMPVSVIASIVDEHDTKLWRVIRHYVNKAYSAKSFKGVQQVGIDETSTRKGHNYVTVFADCEQGDVLFAIEGKDASTIGAFVEELPKHQATPKQITEISMDMSPSFISGAGKLLDKASITFDKFHVVKQLNEALDKVRRDEQKINPLLKKSRYIWLKNPNNLTAEQQKKLKTLSHENTKTAKVYQMKLTFQDIYRTIDDVNTADAAMKKWLSWAVRSRIKPVKQFANMVKTHYQGVLRYFISRLTAGKSESINSRIQEIKRRAKGFSNINNFICMIYLEAGNLNLHS